MKMFLLSSLFLLHFTAISQVVRNQPGFLISAITKGGIEKASVKNRRTTETVLTNEQGSFLFQRGPLLTDTLQISAIGFETAQLTYQELLQRDNRYSLSPKELRLKDLIIQTTQYMPTSLSASWILK